MNKIRRALLGDKEAQETITARYELLPCPFCGGEASLFVQNGVRVISPSVTHHQKFWSMDVGLRGYRWKCDKGRRESLEHPPASTGILQGLQIP